MHRDVKPSNILLDDERGALLTDFGLAKRSDYSMLTSPGQMLGTLDYIAPELLRGAAPGPATDLYALGCVVFECLAGTPPFGGRNVFEVGMAHLGDRPAGPVRGPRRRAGRAVAGTCWRRSPSGRRSGRPPPPPTRSSCSPQCDRVRVAAVLPRGAQVAGYEVEGVLGRGGMGIVYEAREPAAGREVALKVFAATNGMDPSFRKRFQREGRIQAAIDHPSIATVYEAGEWEDALFIAMRLVRGPNLKDADHRRRARGRAAAAHPHPDRRRARRGPRGRPDHRDVKPAEHPRRRGRPRLPRRLRAHEGPRRHRPHARGRVRRHDRLQRARSRSAASRRPPPRDVYSLGAVLYECLTGTVPFPRHADAAVMYAHLSEPPPLVTRGAAGPAAALDDVVCRAMAKDPQRAPGRPPAR